MPDILQWIHSFEQKTKKGIIQKHKIKEKNFEPKFDGSGKAFYKDFEVKRVFGCPGNDPKKDRCLWTTEIRFPEGLI